MVAGAIPEAMLAPYPGATTCGCGIGEFQAAGFVIPPEFSAFGTGQFRRDGDEGNRRAVCMVANEMLAVACQSPTDSDAPSDDISFEFKHFVGQCQLRMLDPRLALSSGAMHKARVAADTSVEGERLSPLAKIMRDSLDVQTGGEEGQGYLQVTMKTYDPRLLEKRKGPADVSTKT